MNILALETSCDETSAAIVKNGREILASVIASQIDIHQKYGGVVPEIASRQHILYITPVLNETLATAGLTWAGIDAVAVTNGPGLAGALLVGVNVGKAIAFAHQKPLVGVNHIESHIYANWLIPPGEEAGKPPAFPLVCLIVSGGHTEIILIENHGSYHLLGKTQDDAAGEAFDKVARVIGLGYPGGPMVEKAALEGNSARFPFTKSKLKGTYDFSFSGLKTAVLRKVQEYQAPPPKPASFSGLEQEKALKLTAKSSAVLKTGNQLNLQEKEPEKVVSTLPVADIAASFQASVVEVLAEKLVQAAIEYSAQHILIAGGVAANKALRGGIEARAKKAGIPFSFPLPLFCTDNAAMVGSAAFFKLMETGLPAAEIALDWGLDIRPGWELVR